MGINTFSVSKFYVPDKQLAEYTNKYKQRARKRLEALLTLMNSLVKSPEETKVIKINSFFNQLAYQSDISLWRQKDYWASRLEFLGKGAGDCEDYSVAKFLTLIQIGVPKEKLFLTYVRAKGYVESAHMVVSYYQEPGTIPFILDNYNKQILPATQRNDITPVYSFTAKDLYIQKQKGLGKKVNPRSTKNLNKLKNIDLEIFER
jgi:predicted transglutaminase-like cysteine proteinase